MPSLQTCARQIQEEDDDPRSGNEDGDSDPSNGPDDGHNPGNESDPSDAGARGPAQADGPDAGTRLGTAGGRTSGRDQPDARERREGPAADSDEGGVTGTFVAEQHGQTGTFVAEPNSQDGCGRAAGHPEAGRSNGAAAAVDHSYAWHDRVASVLAEAGIGGWTGRAETVPMPMVKAILEEVGPHVHEGGGELGIDCFPADRDGSSEAIAGPKTWQTTKRGPIPWYYWWTLRPLERRPS